MNESSPLHDPNLQRFVQDFDAVADFVQTVSDGDRRCARAETVSVGDVEFTTEWQM